MRRLPRGQVERIIRMLLVQNIIHLYEHFNSIPMQIFFLSLRYLLAIIVAVAIYP